MCGSVYNSISHTPRTKNKEIEIHTWKSATKLQEQKENNVISPPPAPKEIEDYLANIGVI
jgi:hypothetical protein